MNRVYLIGNVGKTPEQVGKVVKTSLATTEYQKKDGESERYTEWHNLVFFGIQGETALKYVKKGSKIGVEGKIKTDEHKGKKYTQIVVFSLELLDGKTEQKPSLDDDDIPF